MIPFRFTNWQNSLLVKVAPLSVTILRGNPWVENIIHSFSIVFADVMDFISTTSIHLE